MYLRWKQVSDFNNTYRKMGNASRETMNLAKSQRQYHSNFRAQIPEMDYWQQNTSDLRTTFSRGCEPKALKLLED